MKKIISEFEIETIDVETESFYNKELFFNMNTKEDYDYVLGKLIEKNL